MMTPTAYNASVAGRLWPHVALPQPLPALDPATPAFTSAVVVWQIALGLRPDGQLGPATWAAMRRHATPPSASAPVLGIDVSGHQPYIDWPAVYAAGYRYAWVKATEPRTGYVYGRLAEHVHAAAAAGLAVGAYTFNAARDKRTDAKASPERDADAFLDAVRGLPLTLPLAIDEEEMYQGRRIRGPDGKLRGDPKYKMTAAAIVEWDERVAVRLTEGAGRPPVFYAYTAMLRYLAPAVSRGSVLLDCPLWQSQVGDGGGPRSKPATHVKPWPEAAVHQYSWTGRITGVLSKARRPANVDLNRCTAATLAALRGV